MARTRTRFSLALATLALLIVGVTPVLGAHNGNNKATLAGGATGNAIVNYSEGTGTFSGTVTTDGLEPGDYTFQVSLNGTNRTVICEFTVSQDGTRDGCSANGLTLSGFNTAEIVDDNGDVVASGIFARRGNCRDADQAGSLCEANDAPGRP
ncbi:MAG: hypothetical protein ABIZ57_07730 [Candidatus Limnocylindria bacterium]